MNAAHLDITHMTEQDYLIHQYLLEDTRPYPDAVDDGVEQDDLDPPF